MRLIDRRKRRETGAAWARLEAARCRGPLRPASWPGVVLRLGLGGVLYAALVWVHPWLFGVSPLP